MISPELKNILGTINQTQFGKALKAYLESELADIENIANIPAGASMEQVYGRQIASKTLKKLFGFFDGVQVDGPRKNDYD